MYIFLIRSCKKLVKFIFLFTSNKQSFQNKILDEQNRLIFEAILNKL